METSATTAASVISSTTPGARTRLAESFDNFLKLLTTQLQHQDPLAPMDSTEFTNQLVGFASLEQSISLNDNLQKLIGMQKTSSIANGLDFLGKRIEATGDVTALVDGYGEWNYALPSNASSVTLRIVDERGVEVLETAGGNTIGAHKFVWDGRDSNGMPLPDGNYQLVVSATNDRGEPIRTITTIVGHVTGIETADDKLTLFIGRLGVPIDEILSVQNATGPSAV